MKKKEQRDLLISMQTIMQQNELSQEELIETLDDVFKKTFGRDFSLLGEIDKTRIIEIENAIVETKIDFDKFEFEVYRIWKINNGEIEYKDLFRELNIESPLILDKNLNEGDEFIEQIDLSKISNSKRQQLHQLLIQKLKESEKEKVFNKFNQLINTIVVAKVEKIMENHILLQYMNESIFLHKNEFSKNDTFKIGENKKVLIYDILKASKESQIIGTRSRSKFVEELIKLENNYVNNGTIEIKAISRKPGFKTKLTVISNNPLIDPIGSIIGVKGSKIKPVINEINGEIIDIVQHDDDIKQLIINLFYPINIEGIYVDKENNTAAILINDKDFLQAIGKQGINIKLIAQIIGFKTINVITKSNIDKVDFEFEKINSSSSKSFSKNSSRQNQNNSFKLEIKTLDELIEEGNKLEENYDYEEEEES